MKLLRRLTGACAALIAAGVFSWAEAAIVNIDPGAYAGRYVVIHSTGWMKGPQQVDLAPGAHVIQVAGDFRGQVRITVDAAGQVTSDNPDAIAAAGSTLTFQTTDITIDPIADYTAQGGLWTPYYISDTWLSGPQTFTAVRNLGFLVQVGSVHLGRVRVHVDAAGNLTSENPVALSTSGATGTFNMVDVSVDPTEEFTAQGGVWTPYGVTTSHRSGPLTFKFPPTLGFLLQVGYHVGNRTEITVDAAGEVASTNPEAMTGSGSTLTLNMTDVTVDPADYAGDWYGLGLLTGPQFGPLTFKVPPTIPHRIRVGAYAGGDVEFEMDAAGMAVSGNPLAVDAVGASLVFETTTINIETDSTVPWLLVNYVKPWGVGDAEVTLVPNLRYALGRSGSTSRPVFAVASPCAVNPAVVEQDGDVYAISCGAADSDDDGAPDDVDNCPYAANADQLDRDLDGLGDVCDGDLDGDGFANAGDNCPESANPGQEDLDGDGLGDLCDDDADGDAVADAVDNCPVDANPDQADSEGDGLGDVCDTDDDNDLIEDLADNCPLDANQAQADYDGDGSGDVCDGDEDGDFVPNEADLCPLSPMDLAINLDGCTGGQAIALACVREAFVQHGQYVSCVAHAANAAAEEGLISAKEKAGFVKQAAKK